MMKSLERLLPKVKIPKEVQLEDRVLRFLTSLGYLPILAVGVLQFYFMKRYSSTLTNSATLMVTVPGKNGHQWDYPDSPDYWSQDIAERKAPFLMEFCKPTFPDSTCADIDPFPENFGMSSCIEAYSRGWCAHPSISDLCCATCQRSTRKTWNCSSDDHKELCSNNLVPEEASWYTACSRMCALPNQFDCFDPIRRLEQRSITSVRFVLSVEANAFTMTGGFEAPSKSYFRTVYFLQNLVAEVNLSYTFKLPRPAPWFFETERFVKAEGSQSDAFTVVLDSKESVFSIRKPGEDVLLSLSELAHLAGTGDKSLPFAAASGQVNCFTDPYDYPPANFGTFDQPQATVATPVCFLAFAVMLKNPSIVEVKAWDFPDGLSDRPPVHESFVSLWIKHEDPADFNADTMIRVARERLANIQDVKLSFDYYLHCMYTLHAPITAGEAALQLSENLTVSVGDISAEVESGELNVFIQAYENLQLIELLAANSAQALGGNASLAEAPTSWVRVNLTVESVPGAPQAVQLTDPQDFIDAYSQGVGEPVQTWMLADLQYINKEYVVYSTTVNNGFQLQTIEGNSFHRVPDFSSCLLNFLSLMVLLSFPIKVVGAVAKSCLGKLSQVYSRAALEKLSLPAAVARSMSKLIVHRSNYAQLADAGSGNAKQISKARIRELLMQVMGSDVPDAYVDFCVGVLSDAQEEDGLLDFQHFADSQASAGDAVDTSLLLTLLDADRKPSLLERVFTPAHLKHALAKGRKQSHAGSDSCVELIAPEDKAGDEGKKPAVDEDKKLFQSLLMRCGMLEAKIGKLEKELVESEADVAKLEKELAEKPGESSSQLEARIETLEQFISTKLAGLRSLDGMQNVLTRCEHESQAIDRAEYLLESVRVLQGRTTALNLLQQQQGMLALS
eukprot:TRINITY_DN79950_c0_g1_i1.p1 TRINITY_DN79950_c0_g1~~TRINITY_DN79950_c0_g1_i1.p1  ORF type:complete len:902 (-),score=117.51 TRINITY_DN79950_c0_g1_i1:21-2726(-)